MDFGDLVILLILLAPLLRRLFGKKQKPTSLPPRDAVDGLPSARPVEDPLAEALRQIRVALAEPEPTAPPVAASSPPKPLPARPKPLGPKPKRTPEFHVLGAFEHDEHGFGKSNPISEETFERKGVSSASTDRIKQNALHKVDLRTPIEVQHDDPASASDFAHMLTDAARLREAFVMKEILDPPRSKHRGR